MRCLQQQAAHSNNIPPCVRQHVTASIQLQVVSEFVEIEGEELVDVNISADQDVGTIYTVNVPVRRVKPQVRCCLVSASVVLARCHLLLTGTGCCVLVDTAAATSQAPCCRRESP